MTLWYGAALAVALALFGATVYAIRAQQLRARLDRALAHELADVTQEAEEASNNTRLKDRLQRRFALERLGKPLSIDLHELHQAVDPGAGTPCGGGSVSSRTGCRSTAC